MLTVKVLNELKTGNYNLYCVEADYRPNNPNKPKYYVFSKSEKNAKNKFKNSLSWLKIYSCKIVDDEFKNMVLETFPECFYKYTLICDLGNE